MRPREEYSSPNLTPLLDVVLQLITFFMMLIHFGVKIEGETKAVRLPTAPAAMPSNEMAVDRLVVAIDRNGRLLTDEGALDGRSASRWWADQAKLRREGRESLGGPVNELPTLVVLRADKDASYGAVRRALAAAQERGFAHFTLVVLRSRTT
ncbi:MAG TPA: biopolymer transporter ExbD [Isosphaeraceae bacterium]|jgi:biopolymer transport protein ExbD|nr:biopolymer transporter ExbD [Isosphaeraceae bacterium]